MTTTAATPASAEYTTTSTSDAHDGKIAARATSSSEESPPTGRLRFASITTGHGTAAEQLPTDEQRQPVGGQVDP